MTDHILPAFSPLADIHHDSRFTKFGNRLCTSAEERLSPSEDQLSGKNAIRPAATLNDESILATLFFRLCCEVTFAEESETTRIDRS